MATLKEIKRSSRSESLRGNFMVDTVRGVIRVRKWPRKRGRPTSARQLWWIDWFKQANKLAKYVDAATARRAIQLTLGSGQYPRDIILSAMRGRLYNWVDQNGKKWRSMAAIQDISNSLDILAQDIGSILVRAVDRWRAPDPGNVGEVLTNQGPDAPPSWETVTTGGGQANVPGSPVVCDDTVSEYIFDVSAEFSVNMMLENVGFASNSRAFVQVSTDGGATYKGGATDYTVYWFTKAADGNGDTSVCLAAFGDHTTTGNINWRFDNLRSGRLVYQAAVGVTGSDFGLRSGRGNFDGAITHIKIYASANFDRGTIRCIGLH